MTTDDQSLEPEASRARIEIAARIAYGRYLIESGEEMLRLLELLTGEADEQLPPAPPPIGMMPSAAARSATAISRALTVQPVHDRPQTRRRDEPCELSRRAGARGCTNRHNARPLMR